MKCVIMMEWMVRPTLFHIKAQCDEYIRYYKVLAVDVKHITQSSNHTCRQLITGSNGLIALVLVKQAYNT